jgi:hypothetical protein
MQQSVFATTATPSLSLHPARWAVFLFLCGLSLGESPGLRAQSFAWAAKNSAITHKSQVAADGAGNSYVTTAFKGTVSVGGFTLTSHGGLDILLVGYNPSGAVQWARRIGSTGDEMAGDVAVSTSGGYVYVTGSFVATAKFGSYHGLEGASVVSAGGSDVFVARYVAATGTLDWVRRAGSKTADFSNGIFVDGAGNAYVTGEFSDKIPFTGAEFPTILSSAGLSDIFVAKYSASGNFQMARRLGGTGHDAGRAVAVDSYNGDIYLTGAYAPASHPYISNIFTAKFNAAGAFQWTRTAGAANTYDVGNDIIVTAGGAYVVGDFGGSLSFGGHGLTAAGGSDAFLVHYPYQGGGSAAWAKRYGGNGWDEGNSIAEKFGEYYLGGTFTGTVSFGHNTFTALGGAADRDLHVTRLFSDGTPCWTQRIGSTGFDYGRGGLAVPTTNAVFATGSYGGNTIALGAKTLIGAGNLVTKINAPSLPGVDGFRLINAGTEADLGAIGGFSEINYAAIGTKAINIKVNTGPAVVGSVKLELDGVAKTENLAPYTWAGDTPKDGGTNYLAFTPSLGSHKLVATAYSGPNGTGVKGLTKILFFTVTDQPVVSSLTLINAATDKAVGPLSPGQTINYASLGTNQINIRANTLPGTVGSVKFNLDGVTKTENAAPYAYAGDTPKDGGTNYHAFTPGVGTHKLVVTPYAGPNGSGAAGTPYEVSFKVESGGFAAAEAGRLAVEGPAGSESTPLTAAPNPFTDRTWLTFTATEDGPARLEVYGPAGTRVGLLFEGTVEAGKQYRYAFEGGSLPAGLYVGRLTTGNRVTHCKLLLGR